MKRPTNFHKAIAAKGVTIEFLQHKAKLYYIMHGNEYFFHCAECEYNSILSGCGVIDWGQFVDDLRKDCLLKFLPKKKKRKK